MIIFLDILLNANHKDKKYRGEIVKAGTLTTSYAKIAERTGSSLRTVRTVLRDLETTHEVTRQSNSKFTIITITNWHLYQGGDTLNDFETTSKRQSNDKQTTTNKNVKNVKNEKNIYIVREVIDHLNKKTGKNYKPSTPKTQALVNSRLSEDFKLEDFKKVIDVKHDEWSQSDMEIYLRPETLFGNKFESYLNQKQEENFKVLF